MADRLGPPDLLLLSGDLTYSGTREQFGRGDRLLDALLGWLSASGATESRGGAHGRHGPFFLSQSRFERFTRQGGARVHGTAERVERSVASYRGILGAWARQGNGSGDRSDSGGTPAVCASSDQGDNSTEL